MSGVVEERPHSLRSVPSNSSIASATSLSRRPRTRARSKTLTGNSSPRPDNIIISNNGESVDLFQDPSPISPNDNSLVVAESRTELPNAVSPNLSASSGKLESEPIRVVRESSSLVE